MHQRYIIDDEYSMSHNIFTAIETQWTRLQSIMLYRCKSRVRPKHRSIHGRYSGMALKLVGYAIPLLLSDPNSLLFNRDGLIIMLADRDTNMSHILNSTTWIGSPSLALNIAIPSACRPLIDTNHEIHGLNCHPLSRLLQRNRAVAAHIAA